MATGLSIDLIHSAIVAVPCLSAIAVYFVISALHPLASWPRYWSAGSGVFSLREFSVLVLILDCGCRGWSVFITLSFYSLGIDALLAGFRYSRY